MPEYYEPGPWRRRIVLAVLVIGVLLAVDAIWVVLKVRGQMEVARCIKRRSSSSRVASSREITGAVCRAKQPHR